MALAMERVAPSEFEHGRLDRPGRIVVCAAAGWCPFCRAFLPRFAARDGTGEFTLGLADLSDEENPLWELWKIEVVPTLLAFDDGHLVGRIDGRPLAGLDEDDLDAMPGLFGPSTPNRNATTSGR
ncbi:MAG: thioredoxin family protein [Thermoplasmata archaeon]